MAFSELGSKVERLGSGYCLAGKFYIWAREGEGFCESVEEGQQEPPRFPALCLIMPPTASFHPSCR